MQQSYSCISQYPGLCLCSYICNQFESIINNFLTRTTVLDISKTLERFGLWNWCRNTQALSPEEFLQLKSLVMNASFHWHVFWCPRNQFRFHPSLTNLPCTLRIYISDLLRKILRLLLNIYVVDITVYTHIVRNQNPDPGRWCRIWSTLDNSLYEWLSYKI